MGRVPIAHCWATCTTGKGGGGLLGLCGVILSSSHNEFWELHVQHFSAAYKINYGYQSPKGTHKLRSGLWDMWTGMHGLFLGIAGITNSGKN